MAEPLAGFMFDVDGTLVLGDRATQGYAVLPGAAEVLTSLADRDIPFVVLTNGSLYPPPKQAAKLRDRIVALEKESRGDSGSTERPAASPKSRRPRRR